MRKADSHKGQNGVVLVIAGSETYPGAAYLTAMAALRTGMDIVYVACPEKVAFTLNSLSCELITIKLPGSKFISSHVKKALELAQKADVVVIGPGLGRDEETLEAVREFLLENSTTTIIDADAIYALTQPLMHNTIITPHKEEFKFLYPDFEDVKEAIKNLSSKDTIILLKGPVDLISNGTIVAENITGNASMTKGGSGDVLAGLCAGLFAISKDKFQAAKDAAFYNGKIGEHLYQEQGFGWITSEMLKYIPEALMRANGNNNKYW